MYEYEINNRGHRWKYDDEYLDILGYYPGDPHNGPICVACGYGFCHHCLDGPEIDCPEVIDAELPEPVLHITSGSTATSLSAGANGAAKSRSTGANNRPTNSSAGA